MDFIRNLLGAGLLVSLSACASGDEATRRPPLNSERIAETFGSYGVHVVAQSRAQRASCLFSGSGDSRVCRTLALVRYAAVPDPRIASSLDRVRDGASLGATLQADGWTVTKRHRLIDEFNAEAPVYGGLQRFFALDDAPSLAVHLYTLDAERGATTVPVAELLEVHHPAYLSADELLKIYGTNLEASGGQIDGWLGDLQSAFSGDAPFN